MSINCVSLMGRITYPIEVKTTPNGVSVASFQLAVDRPYQASGQDRQTDFIDCVAWRGTAEFLGRNFKKGDMLALTGEIQTRNYTDKSGNNRKITEIVASNISFCGSKENSVQATKTQNTAGLDVSNDDFEELPW